MTDKRNVTFFLKATLYSFPSDAMRKEIQAHCVAISTFTWHRNGLVLFSHSFPVYPSSSESPYDVSTLFDVYILHAGAIVELIIGMTRSEGRNGWTPVRSGRLTTIPITHSSQEEEVPFLHQTSHLFYLVRRKTRHRQWRQETRIAESREKVKPKKCTSPYQSSNPSLVKWTLNIERKSL